MKSPLNNVTHLIKPRLQGDVLLAMVMRFCLIVASPVHSENRTLSQLRTSDVTAEKNRRKREKKSREVQHAELFTTK